MREKYFDMVVGHPAQGDIQVETKYHQGRQTEITFVRRDVRKRESITLSLSDGELKALADFLDEAREMFHGTN